MPKSPVVEELMDREEKMDMTPMIDCVFLLLIFFMCATKFKRLEKKLDAFLPEDQGLAKSLANTPVEPLKIMIRADKGGAAAEIFLNARKFGTATTNFTQSRTTVWNEVDSYLKNNISKFEKIEIDAQRDVSFQYVAQALNYSVKANLQYQRANPGSEPKKITFTGDMAALAAAAGLIPS
jgi:biopolymer transport protein ExbD